MSTDASTWQPRSTVGEPITGNSLAKAHNASLHHVWYSLVKKEPVEPQRGVCLIKLDTKGQPKEVIFDRAVILDVVGLIQSPESRFSLDPASVPPLYVCYLQTLTGTRKVPSGAKVVVQESAVDATAAPSKSARRPKKSSNVGSVVPSTKHTSPIPSVHGLTAPATPEPQIVSALSNDDASPVQRALLATAEKLKRKRNDPPLHEAIPSTSKSSSVSRGIVINEITWFRHHPHCISGVIPAVEKGVASRGLTSNSQGNTKVAAFAIEGTLFNAPSILERDPSKYIRCDDNIGQSLHELMELGYCIVFFGSYPAVHHTSLSHIQEKTMRIKNFCAKECPTISPIVIISTVSNFVPESPYLLPKRGMWDYFVKHHNGGVVPSSSYSFYVGNLWDPEDLKRARKVESIPGEEEAAKSGLHLDAEFAESCGVRFVTSAEFSQRLGIPSGSL